MLRVVASRSRGCFASRALGPNLWTYAHWEQGVGELIGDWQPAQCAFSTVASAMGTSAGCSSSLLPLVPQSAMRAAACEAAPSLASQCRSFARLPFKLPSGEIPKKPPPKTSQADNDDFANVHDDNKRTPNDLTNAMYMPWERRQFEGGELKWWEKTYWALIVLAVAGLGIKYMFDPMMNKGDAEMDAEMEARMQGEARSVLLGKSFLIDDDAFEGMTPEEIEKFVKKQTGASESDPFEGMTPEEINEYVKNN